jgi:hypothetical protein
MLRPKPDTRSQFTRPGVAEGAVCGKHQRKSPAALAAGPISLFIKRGNRKFSNWKQMSFLLLWIWILLFL